jgi:hypothetical protein
MAAEAMPANTIITHSSVSRHSSTKWASSDSRSYWTRHKNDGVVLVSLNSCDMWRDCVAVWYRRHVMRFFHQYKVRKRMRPLTTNKNSIEASAALVRVAQKNVFNCIIVSPILIEQCQCHDRFKCSRPFVGKSGNLPRSACLLKIFTILGDEPKVSIVGFHTLLDQVKT